MNCLTLGMKGNAVGALRWALCQSRKGTILYSMPFTADTAKPIINSVPSSICQVCDGNSPLRAHGYATPKSAAKISEAMATSQNQVVGSGAGRLRVSNNHAVILA